MPLDGFRCTECNGPDFHQNIDETIIGYIDDTGDVVDYGDVIDSTGSWNAPCICDNCGKEYSSIPSKSPEEEWLEAKKRSYLQTKGVKCPICNSSNISGIGNELLHEGSVFQYVTCTDCSAEWNDIYHLREVEIISYPTDMVPAGLIDIPAPAPGIPNPNEAFKDSNEDN